MATRPWPSGILPARRPRPRALEDFPSLGPLRAFPPGTQPALFRRVRTAGRSPIHVWLASLTWLQLDVARTTLLDFVSQHPVSRPAAVVFPVLLLTGLLGEAMRRVLHALPLGWDIPTPCPPSARFRQTFADLTPALTSFVAAAPLLPGAAKASIFHGEVKYGPDSVLSPGLRSGDPRGSPLPTRPRAGPEEGSMDLRRVTPIATL